MNFEVIILAAGKGTRMRSAMPKVLHPLAGRPLLGHVIDTAKSLQANAIHVVYGHGGETVPEAFADNTLNWIRQTEQNGTGHAVSLALPDVNNESNVLVMYGDIPLIRAETLAPLLSLSTDSPLSLLTAQVEKPDGLGRILRDEQNQIIAIREEKDATETEKANHEINTGFLAAPASRLRTWLQQLGNDNAQGEFYLTDIVETAVAEGVTVNGCRATHEWEILGVNSKLELARLERIYQQQQAEALMRDGVTIRDPQRFDLRGQLVTGADCELDINVVFEGHVELGDRAKIGQNCTLIDTVLGDDVTVHPNTIIEGARIASHCNVGPFARIRPDTIMAEHSRVGNFVEIKKSAIGAGSKINHLSYVGDSEVGRDVNIGAGTITCNYDGANKHKTVIGDGAFIGSDSQLVAPVKVGANATIGAGSTISTDAPAEQLTITRAKQRSLRGWRRPVKKK